MNIVRTYLYKLKPTDKHIIQFEQWLGVCRLIYNMALEIKDAWYKKRRVNISKGELQKQITDIRNEWEWIGDVHSQVLQDVTDRLFRAYDNFFRRVKEKRKGKKQKVGFPKFAKKHKFISFGFKQGVKIHPNTNVISLPKIGKIKYRNSRELKGEILHTRVIKKADGWYVAITTELKTSKLPSKKPKRKYIANDLGLIHLIVDSNGYKIQTPKYYRGNEKKLRLLQRAVSRKKLGSSNWKKAQQKVARQHKIIADSRKDFLHKVSSNQVNENQVIGFEDLNISGMVRNHNLSKSILDAGWGMLMAMTKYKCDWYGRTMVKLNRFYPSSKKCSTLNCDYVMDKLPLNIRTWTCPKCKTIHDRDENASTNLEVELKKAVGHTVSSCGVPKGKHCRTSTSEKSECKFDKPKNLR